MGDLSLGLSLSRRATSSATPAVPEIQLFSVGPQSGDDLPITVNTDDANPSHTLYLVGVPNGDPAPSAAEIQAGQANGGGDADYWIDGYVMSGDLTDEPVSWDREGASGDFDFYAVVVADGGTSSVASDTGVTVTQASPFSFTVYTYDGAGTTSVPFTVDLSGYSVGEQITLVIGPENNCSAITINGNSATKVSTDAGNTYGRAGVFTYTLQTGEDAAGISVTATMGAASNAVSMTVMGLAGYAYADHDSDRDNSGNPVSPSATISDASNQCVIVTMGEAGEFSGTTATPPPSYGAATEQEQGIVRSETGYAVATFAADQPVGAVTDTVTAAANGNDVVATLVVLEAV